MPERVMGSGVRGLVSTLSRLLLVAALVSMLVVIDPGVADAKKVPETLADQRPAQVGLVEVDFPIDFVAITPYAPNTGRVRLLKDLDIDIAGRAVVIVEDIVDTGLTTAFIHGELSRRSPASVSVCTLVDRPARRVVPVELDHVGIEIPDQFVIGYGLDFEGRYRNLRVLAAADAEVLAADPDAYVSELYPA